MKVRAFLKLDNCLEIQLDPGESVRAARPLPYYSDDIRVGDVVEQKGRYHRIVSMHTEEVVDEKTAD